MNFEVFEKRRKSVYNSNPKRSKRADAFNAPFAVWPKRFVYKFSYHLVV